MEEFTFISHKRSTDRRGKNFERENGNRDKAKSQLLSVPDKVFKLGGAVNPEEMIEMNANTANNIRDLGQSGEASGPQMDSRTESQREQQLVFNNSVDQLIARLQEKTEMLSVKEEDKDVDDWELVNVNLSSAPAADRKKDDAKEKKLSEIVHAISKGANPYTIAGKRGVRISGLVREIAEYAVRCEEKAA